MVFFPSPERWVWNWHVTAECAPGRTGRTVQGTKKQSQMAHTIGSAHLQTGCIQHLWLYCQHICVCIVCRYHITSLVCTKSYRYLGQTDQDLFWGMTNYDLLWSVVENLKSNCSWVFWIFFATSTESSSIFGKESGQLFGVHSWTLAGEGAHS
jgi:hypothetical protein